ncbi:GNAT family protein [Sphingobacterium thermophilum]|uniref:GNAT family protein n=1 Tax=Sphingobacterium thermophilum TaxID=768534 RepID=A0ABP8QY92_9SPHI
MTILIHIKINDDIELCQLQREDAQDIYSTIDGERAFLGRWLPFVSFTQDIVDTQAYVDSIVNAPESSYEYVFTIRENGKFVGMIGLVRSDYNNKKTEIGYWMSEKSQHKGIMSRSVKALCRFAFEELHMNRIMIKCAVGNTASSNIPKRLGFTFEGIERQGELFPDGHFEDLEIYSLLKSEFISPNNL